MGLVRDKATAQLKMEQALEALGLLSFPKMEEHLDYIKKLLDNGQLINLTLLRTSSLVHSTKSYKLLL